LISLIIYLPFRGLFSTYLISKLEFSPYLSLFKDFLIGFILIWMLIIISKFIYLKKYREFEFSQKLIFFGLLGLILFVNIWSVLSSFVFNTSYLKLYINGYYFELWWLVFLVLNILLGVIIKYTKLFDPKALQVFLNRINLAILASFLSILIFSSLSIFFGQIKILDNFGYTKTDLSYNSASLFSSNNSCYRKDTIFSPCRLQGGFVHPLHFAGYLVLFIPYLCFQVLKNYSKYNYIIKFGFVFLLFTNLLLIYLSYARFTYIIIGTSIFLILFHYFKTLMNKAYLKNFLSFLSLSLLILSSSFWLVVFSVDIQKDLAFLPSSLIRNGSTLEHQKFHIVNTYVINNSRDKLWTGYGLGVYGSAAKEKYQKLVINPIYQKFSKYSISQNLGTPKFMFAENWFAQVYLNGGIFYFVAYFGILSVLTFGVRHIFLNNKKASFKLTSQEILLGSIYLGILTSNFYIHLFESQEVVNFLGISYFWWSIFSKKSSVDQKMKGL
jgi:hypothetical protein